MQRNAGRLADTEYDLLIIGGGISGACAAWDATLRGLRVALVEKGDFGEATSSASSKLLHGGIRYLQQGLLGKVRESIEERQSFLKIAPHLLRPVSFLIPTYKNPLRGRALLAAGMTVYDLIGFDRNHGLPEDRHLPGFRLLSREETLSREPLIPAEGLTGSVLYTECQMYNSERMTLAFVAGAAARGADVANYLEVRELIGSEEEVTGVRALDRVSGDEFEIRAKLVANVSGPWAFRLIDLLKGRSAGRAMHHAKGCHLVTAPLTEGHALALATAHKNEALINRGGRHIFLIPWRGRTLIGTTNVPFSGEPDDLNVTDEDVGDFVEEINRAIPGLNLGRQQVHYAFSGLYPLIDKDVKERVYQGSGKYLIYDHSRTDHVEGMITAIGAKFTTARRLAEKAIDLAVRKLGKGCAPCATATTPVDGGEMPGLNEYLAGEARQHGLPVEEDSLRDLVSNHGTRFRVVLKPVKSDPQLALRLSTGRATTRASVRYAAREEMALQLSDVVFRRTGLGTIGHPGAECLETCASILAEEHGWTPERIKAEIENVERTFRMFS